MRRWATPWPSTGTADEALVLGNSTGLRGLEDNRVLGNQRLIVKLESRVFTPWSVMGFRFMVFGFADVGTVGGEKDPIVQQKIYSSLGLGFRINNPGPGAAVDPGAHRLREQHRRKRICPGLQARRGGLSGDQMPGTIPGGFAFR